MAKTFTKESLLEHLGWDSYTPAEERFFEHDFRVPLFTNELVYEMAYDRPVAKYPREKSSINHIRAEFLREVILDNLKSIEIPATGLNLLGYWIEGELNIDSCVVRFPVNILGSNMRSHFSLKNAQVPHLNFSDSKFKSINADGAHISRSLVLSKSSVIEIARFLGTYIGSDFTCSQAVFLGDETSLAADKIRVDGSIFLESIIANGEVRFVDARVDGSIESRNSIYLSKENSLVADRIDIGGDVRLSSIAADGNVRFLSAEIQGQFDCGGAMVKGEMILQDAVIHNGALLHFNHVEKLNVETAKFMKIFDTVNSWPKGGNLLLSGTTYTGFAGIAPNDAESRLDWLSRLGEFTPQPYRQLAKVFRSEGKTRDANMVLAEMERQMRYPAVKEIGGKKMPFVQRTFDYLFGLFSDYGFNLWKTAGWLFAFILLLSYLAQLTYASGQMVPNSPVILNSNDWQNAKGTSEWLEDYGQEWQTFNGLFYASDVVIPLVDFGQESAWTPANRCDYLFVFKCNQWQGKIVWLMNFWFKAMGWLLATFLIASLSNYFSSRTNE